LRDAYLWRLGHATAGKESPQTSNGNQPRPVSKALVWKGGKSIAWQDRPSFKAKAERGEYHISPSYDTLSGIAGYVVEHFATARYLESAGTAEQAKAIAQRDYESGK
jgi:hypothetical protein